MPIFYITLCALVLLDIGTLSHSWPWHAAYLSNVHLAFGGEKTVFWSLAVEEQFYLVWPLLIALTSRRYLLHVTVAVVLSALAWKSARTCSVFSRSSQTLYCRAIWKPLASDASLPLSATEREGSTSSDGTATAPPAGLRWQPGPAWGSRSSPGSRSARTALSAIHQRPADGSFLHVGRPPGCPRLQRHRGDALKPGPGPVPWPDQLRRVCRPQLGTRCSGEIRWPAPEPSGRPYRSVFDVRYLWGRPGTASSSRSCA
jgi:hypothetical protein